MIRNAPNYAEPHPLVKAGARSVLESRGYENADSHDLSDIGLPAGPQDKPFRGRAQRQRHRGARRTDICSPAGVG